MKDTGVLQPEAGWDPTGGTDPGFKGGAGEAEADGGLDPTGWLLGATVRKQQKVNRIARLCKVVLLLLLRYNEKYYRDLESRLRQTACKREIHV